MLNMLADALKVTRLDPIGRMRESLTVTAGN